MGINDNGDITIVKFIPIDGHPIGGAAAVTETIHSVMYNYLCIKNNNKMPIMININIVSLCQCDHISKHSHEHD